VLTPLLVTSAKLATVKRVRGGVAVGLLWAVAVVDSYTKTSKK